jgi:hypothetical protein
VLPRIVSHANGWWVNVQWQDKEQLRADLDALAVAGFSADLMALFSTAASHECNWINLDRDA